MRRTVICASALLLLLTGFFGRPRPHAFAQESRRRERYTGAGEAFTALLPQRPSAAKTYRPVRFF